MRKMTCLLMGLLLVGCAAPQAGPRSAPTPVSLIIAPPSQTDLDRGLALADRSERVHETIKPPVVRAIADLVAQSKVRALTPDEKVRLTRLNDLRKLADGWVKLYNAYADVLGAILHFQEMSNRNARDETRLSQLLSGLPRNNRNMEDILLRVTLACRELKINVGTL